MIPLIHKKKKKKKTDEIRQSHQKNESFRVTDRRVLKFK